MNYNYWEHLKLITPNFISYKEFMRRWTENNTNYTTLMVRRALIEASFAVSVGRWAHIKTYGPNVRLHVGRFNSDGSKQKAILVVSYYIKNNGSIGREEI